MSLIFNTSASEEHGGDFYNGVATQSVRFPVGEPHLQRTPSSTGDQKTWTSSFWVKRTSLGAGYLWSSAGYSGNDGIAAIYFEDDELHTYYDGSTHTYGKIGNRLYRDLSAWYHICWAVDAANTIHKIWVNGSLESTVTARYPTNFAWGMNRASTLNKFGEAAWGASTQFEGYLADFVHLDGQYLEYDSFAEFKNGVLIPIDTSGLTYGTNGFRLEFKETGVGSGATNTIGADTANSNHLDSAVIAADDCAMPDSPENNFATLNLLDKRGTVTVSEGNLKAVNKVQGNITATIAPTSGKWYWEAYLNDHTNPYIGVQSVNTEGSGASGFSQDAVALNNTGDVYYDVSDQSKNGSANWASTNIISVAYDVDNNKIWWALNGQFYSADASTASTIAYSVVEAGNDAYDLSSQITHGVAFLGSSADDGIVTMNFGQDSTFAGVQDSSTSAKTPSNSADENGNGLFFYAPPSGFLALCTANLPEPTIGANSDTQADDHFETVLYEGNGSTQNVAVNFQPDFTWIKNRDATDAHQLFDSTRGATNVLESDDTTLEVANDDTLTDFTPADESIGFSLGDDVTVNTGSESYVAWNWKANGGTATATISESGDNPAAVVQANPTAGFSLITYTGTGDAGTIAHGLGAVPTMMIIKNRDVADAWAVYHGANTAAPATDYLVLNTTAATADAATYWADTAPTSSVFTVHDAHNVNADGEKYVAYVFADIEGYSKMGSYFGNTSADGAFVYTGFRPAFLLVKSSISGSYSWYLFDNTRNPHNVGGLALFADTGAVEYSSVPVDFLSNGFKWRTTDGGVNNADYDPYIYMAFAEAPFKYANAR